MTTTINPIRLNTSNHLVRFASEKKEASPSITSDNDSVKAEKKKLHQSGMLNILGGTFEGFAIPGLLTYLMYAKTASVSAALPLVGGILALGAVIGKGINSIMRGVDEVNKSR